MAEFKGTKGKWSLRTSKKGNKFISVPLNYDFIKIYGSQDENFELKQTANAKLISKAPEMLEMIEMLCENLELQLSLRSVCGQGNGKNSGCDADSYNGTKLLEDAKQLIKKATKL